MFNGVIYPHGTNFPAGDGCNTWLGVHTQLNIAPPSYTMHCFLPVAFAVMVKLDAH